MSRTLKYLIALLLLFACSDKEKALTPDPSSDGNSQQEKPLLSDDKFGADINPTGNPIGGGEGYNRLLDPSEYLVTNRMELLDALEFAGPQPDSLYSRYHQNRPDRTSEHRHPRRRHTRQWPGQTRLPGRPALLRTTRDHTALCRRRSQHPHHRSSLPGTGHSQTHRADETTTRRRTLLQHTQLPRHSRPNTPTSKSINCELWGWSHAAIFLRAGSTDNHIHPNYLSPQPALRPGLRRGAGPVQRPYRGQFVRLVPPPHRRHWQTRHQL